MYSAGILLSTIRNNELLFLLGRDNKYKTWSDFGGRNESYDKMSPRKTAAREFYEESCGVFFSIQETYHLLEHIQPFICKSYMKNNYFMFLLVINDHEYMKYITDFYNMRTLLLKDKFSHKFIEKDLIRWMTLDEILNNPQIFRCVFHKSFMDNLENIKKCVSI